jgi:asparagine synthase (glutamine-hydrolysing)
MRRLSIIDLAGGWQPFVSENRRVVAVVNGEIYNHQELRRDLLSAGHVFATKSDCEVVVHLYEQIGLPFLERLRGMFAIALLDLDREMLFLARDKMGEKPLAIFEDAGMVAFASEATALVKSGCTPLKLSPSAVIDYLHWGFVPDPGCILSDVRKVAPGSFVSINLRDGAVNEQVYWNLSASNRVVGDPIEILSAAIEDVGRLTTQSDVPIGVGLSSGIDSSAIAVLASRFSSQSVSAVMVGYEGTTWQDETRLAAEFARELGLPAVKVVVSTREVVQAFEGICTDRDDPLGDIGGGAYRALMQACKDSGLKVLLTGMGGDELFWGYPWHREARRACERKRRLRSGNAGLLDYLRVSRPPPSITWALYWLQNAAGLLSSYRDWQRDLTTDPYRLVFWDSTKSPDFSAAESGLPSIAGPALIDHGVDAARRFTGKDLWIDLDTSMTQLLCDTYLCSNGLVIVDRQGMASSIEGRSPLADAKLAEAVVGLRKARSDFELGHKAWLRQVFQKYVPQRVMKLRKRGFTPPWRSWIPAIYSQYSRQLHDGYLVRNGFLSQQGAAALARPFDRLRRPTPLSYSALVLEVWASSLGRQRLNAQGSFGSQSMSILERVKHKGPLG